MRGIWYDYGDFKYPNDRHEAYRAYTTAAKLGYARAEYRLGKMYEDVGDVKRAIHHYERGVAEQDSASLYVHSLPPYLY
jgi:TPR repeat protein